MSKKDQKKAAHKAAKRARKAAKRAAEIQSVATSPVKPSFGGRVDGFMARHAPSDADLRWYRMLKYFGPLALTLGAAAAVVIQM